MSQEQSELTKSLLRRDGRIRLVRQIITSSLDEPEWGKRYEPDTEQVEKSADSLAEQYYEYTNAGVLSTSIILLLIATIDYGMGLNPQVYGLIVDVWAVLFFVRPSFKGPTVIATAVEGRPPDAIRRLQSQEMVFTNIGLGVFAIGFLLQIFAVQFYPSQEVFRNNLISGILPGWITGVFLLVSLFVGLLVFNRLHDRYTVE